MSHFVAYHNADENGEIQKAQHSRFVSRKKAMLDAAMGHTVWIIQGLKSPSRKGKKEFTLRGRFRPDTVIEFPDAGPGVFLISGVADYKFKPPMVLNDLDWFPDLYSEQNNFSFGFNRISNPATIAALEKSLTLKA
jgi:hypothetical protein